MLLERTRYRLASQSPGAYPAQAHPAVAFMDLSTIDIFSEKGGSLVFLALRRARLGYR